MHTMIIRKTIHIFFKTVLTLAAMAFFFGCERDMDDFFGIHQPDHGGNPGNRIPARTDRSVLLIYSDGYNSLSDFLDDNIDTLMNGWIPPAGLRDNILLLYTHKTARYGDYKTPTSPYLIRLTSDRDGRAVADTVVTYPEGTISSSAKQLNEVLTYVNETYPAKGYGLVYLSHATGYLPAGFYGHSDKYTYTEDRMMAKSMRFMDMMPPAVPYVEPERDPSLPKVRSIGQTQSGSSGNYVSYEMDIRDFAEAIPMKLDYIQFDACLMGGIEVAYELREKCSRIGFSQGEVLAEGLDYSSLTTHLLKGDIPDQISVCDDYFQLYDRQYGVYRSATISLVDCENLEPLADLCREIFSKYRERLGCILRSEAQRFYTGNHHWFYDLESIVNNTGASREELKLFHDALDRCVLYKAHTPEFLGSFAIDTFSGFSMYMPSDGHRELDKYYKTLQWNISTGLVE